MKQHEAVLVALRRIIRAVDIQSRKLEKSVGLTTPQLLVMQAIDELGDVPVSQLARHVSLSQATITAILDRLERKALVLRQRSTTDKRVVIARLSEQGRETLAGAPTPLQEHFVERFQSLKDWEQSLLLGSLQRVAEMMDAQDLDAAPLLADRDPASQGLNGRTTQNGA